MENNKLGTSRKSYKGLGKENMTFEEAMKLVKSELHNLDEYVLDVLFDILMEEVNEQHPITSIHNWS